MFLNTLNSLRINVFIFIYVFVLFYLSCASAKRKQKTWLNNVRRTPPPELKGHASSVHPEEFWWDMRLSGSIASLSLSLSFSLTLWHDTEVGAFSWAFRHPHPPHSFSLNLNKLAAGLSTLLGPHLVFDQSVCRMCTKTRSPCQLKLIWSSTIQVTHTE